MKKNQLLLTFFFSLQILLALGQKQDELFANQNDQRYLRRNEKEITDLQYYKQTIRKSYYNLSESTEESSIRSFLNRMIRIKPEFQRYNFAFETLNTRYEPENKDYFVGLFSIGINAFILSILIFLSIIIIFIYRCACKSCKRPSSYYNYKPQVLAKYITSLVFLTILFVACSIVCQIGNFGYLIAQKSQINKMVDQAEFMTNDINQLKSNLDNINSVGPKLVEDFKIPTFNFDSLVGQTVTQIEENSNQYSKGLFAYDLTLFFVIFLTMVAGGGLFLIIFFGLKKVKPSYAGFSYIGFLFLAGSTMLIYCFKNAEQFYIFDYCEQIFQITDLNEIPQYNMGIGNYISCLPSEEGQLISTIGYECYTQYKNGLQIANQRLQILGVNSAKLDNSQQLQDITNQNQLSDDSLKSWITILSQLEKNMEIVTDLTDCKHLITYSLQANEKLCQTGFIFSLFLYSGICGWFISFLLMALYSFKLRRFLKYKSEKEEDSDEDQVNEEEYEEKSPLKKTPSPTKYQDSAIKAINYTKTSANDTSPDQEDFSKGKKYMISDSSVQRLDMNGKQINLKSDSAFEC